MTTSALPLFPTARRGGCTWLAAIWLSAVLFALRALLPTGFMPDPDALRAGRFQIIYCPSAGPLPPGMAVPGHATSGHAMAHHGHAMAMPGHPHDPVGHHPAPDGPSGAGMDASCPFGLAGAHTYVPPQLAVVPAILAMAFLLLPPAAVAAPPAGTIAGPPVGSRAPPY